MRQAVRTWDYGVSFLAGAPDPASPPVAPRPHPDVHVLYAEAVPGGQVVVVEGANAAGEPELGMFFTATSAPPDLRFTSKRVLESPPAATTQHVAFFVLNRGGRAVLVVVGQPGTTSVSYATEAAPGVLVPMAVRDGTAAAVAPAVPVTRIVVANAGGTVYDGPVTDTVVAPDALI